ncbi:MAG: DUF1570 domain-containing protein [Candidatus Nanoarchaeia archaeon]|nr:DUF1570 domain-containing protein [Candidatus Nanoarchaeia archaeon]
MEKEKMFHYKVNCRVKFDKKELDYHISTAREYLNGLFGKSTKCCSVEVFNHNEFPHSDCSGAYHHSCNKICIYYSEDHDSFFSLLLHEMTHNKLHDILGNPPRWLDEGLAQYAVFKNGKVIPGKIKMNSLETILNSAIKDELMPLDYLINGDSFNCNRSLAYAESWSFIHFLINTYRFNKYFKRFKDTKREFFNEDEIKNLEPRWIAYLDLITTSQEACL